MPTQLQVNQVHFLAHSAQTTLFQHKRGHLARAKLEKVGFGVTKPMDPVSSVHKTPSRVKVWKFVCLTPRMDHHKRVQVNVPVSRECHGMRTGIYAKTVHRELTKTKT